MKEEKNFIKFTTKEIAEHIKIQRKICEMKEYSRLKNELLEKVKITMNLKELMKTTILSHKRTRKVINKYSKLYKQEKDITNLFKRQKKEEKNISIKYISSVMDLMELIYKIVNSEIFSIDLSNLQKWYELEMEDMILVNDLIRNLQHYDLLNLTGEEIIKILNNSIKKYIICFEENINYLDIFEKSFPFVNITRKEKIENE